MKLLVAEDERSLARAISRILEKNGYITEVAYDGEEALSLLGQERFDAAIVDVMMPKMDGISLVRTLRAKGNYVPVLILSAKTEVSDKVTGLDAGANDYLGKPFSSEELLARIRVLTRAKPETAHKLSLGNISLNKDNYELSAGEQSFRLTNKEFLLMELFLSNPRQIIPAERLMEKVWGYDAEADISVVWVYISYLRKKLAALKANVEIRASRGVGYLLEEKK